MPAGYRIPDTERIAAVVLGTPAGARADSSGQHLPGRAARDQQLGGQGRVQIGQAGGIRGGVL